VIADKNYLDRVVYVSYEENGDLFHCVGKVLYENEKSLSAGFNFFLGDKIDSLEIRKSSIVKMSIFEDSTSK
jgi:hypothetical protein